MHSSLRLANRQFDADYLNFSLVYTMPNYPSRPHTDRTGRGSQLLTDPQQSHSFLKFLQYCY
jgi:hypothetical protein